MIYIDIGNSYAKIYDNDDDILEILESNKIFDWLEINKDKQILICSVALEVTNKIKKLYPMIKVIDNKIYNKLLNIDNELVYKKGTDRIVTAYGALEKYEAENIIVVDMGTCVTVDVLTDRKYISGYIYPGLNILRTSLNEKVQQLPIAVEPHMMSGDIIDTNDQIFWANIYGMIGAINQFVKIEQEKRKKTKFKVILTGGTIKEFNIFLKENKVQELFSFEYVIDSKLIFYAMNKINSQGLL